MYPTMISYSIVRVSARVRVRVLTSYDLTLQTKSRVGSFPPSTPITFLPPTSFQGTSSNQWDDGKNPSNEPDQSSYNHFFKNNFNTQVGDGTVRHSMV